MNSIQMSPDMTRRLCDIDAFKGYWRALERHTTGLNLLREVAEHGQNVRLMMEKLKDHPISTANLRKIYAGMIDPASGGGWYKDAPNVLEGGESLETAAPEDVEGLLEKLVEWVNEAIDAREFHPLIVVAVFVGVFLQIAPFARGNRKLANLWAQILLFKAGYAYAPYVFLDSLVEEDLPGFYAALKDNQDSLNAGRPDWSAWLRTYLGFLQAQKDVLLNKLEAPEKDLSHVPTLSARILRLFDTHKRLQMKEIIKLTHGRRATIKLRLSELLEQGYLRRHGSGRSTWYSLV